MNDFSEIENELRNLRPVQPSSELFARVEQVLADCGARTTADTRPRWRRYTEMPYKFGFGLAAAAVVLLLFARINMEQRRSAVQNVVQISPASETGPAQGESDGSTSANQFVPAGATQVVYNTLDEGLRFVNGAEAPMRCLRYQTHETLQWRNPHTGESLRVSYPSEEIVLLPVSGQ
jgi:hypothetical protein